jgi:hypothetical protein
VTVRDRGASERARARALSATASHRSLRKTPLILRSTDAPRAGAQRGLVRRSAEMTGLETPDARRSAPARMLRREAVFRLYSESYEGRQALRPRGTPDPVRPGVDPGHSTVEIQRACIGVSMYSITRSHRTAATRAARRGGGARRDRTAVGTLPPVSFLLECNVWNVPSKTPAFSSYSAARAALEQHTAASTAMVPSLLSNRTSKDVHFAVPSPSTR